MAIRNIVKLGEDDFLMQASGCDRLHVTPESLVRVKGGNAFIRSDPDKTKDNKLGVAYEGKLLPYLGKTSVDGWYSVEFDGKKGWISGKYGRLEV